MNRNLLNLILLTALAVSSTACGYERVEPGYVGMVQGVNGFQNDIIAPSRIWVGMRERLYMVETSDQTFSANMSILCQDNLNFDFDITLLVALDTSNEDVIRETFRQIRAGTGDQTESGTARIITAQRLYAMYVAPVIDEAARAVVSRYETSEIIANRQRIIEEIRAAVMESAAGSIMTVKRVTVNNLEFPPVITRAQEQRAERQIQVETERAQHEIERLQAQNDLEIATLENQRMLLEAQGIADSNQIIAASITPGYLGYQQIQMFRHAAEQGDQMFVVPAGDFMNSDFEVSASHAVIDEALRERIRAAQAGSDALSHGDGAAEEAAE